MRRVFPGPEIPARRTAVPYTQHVARPTSTTSCVMKPASRRVLTPGFGHRVPGARRVTPPPTSQQTQGRGRHNSPDVTRPHEGKRVLRRRTSELDTRPPFRSDRSRSAIFQELCTRLGRGRRGSRYAGPGKERGVGGPAAGKQAARVMPAGRCGEAAPRRSRKDGGDPWICARFRPVPNRSRGDVARRPGLRRRRREARRGPRSGARSRWRRAPYREPWPQSAEPGRPGGGTRRWGNRSNSWYEYRPDWRAT